MNSLLIRQCNTIKDLMYSSKTVVTVQKELKFQRRDHDLKVQNHKIKQW